MTSLVERLRQRANDTRDRVKPFNLMLDAAEEIERLRTALEVASDEILSMYRTWVADDYEAMPPENSLPGKAYYSARAALRESTP